MFYSFKICLQSVWAQTTDVSRTKMSMQVLLAGLYPPHNTAMEWSNHLNWQPTNIFSQPYDEDSVH